MGFITSSGRSPRPPGKKRPVSIETLHALECRACPLNRITDNKHPHMKPSGSDKPLLYFLGEAPGEQEDTQGKQFVGKSGKMLRKYVDSDQLQNIRWNNVVRTRPVDNKTPDYVEIECCRPSVVKDIENTKPRAVVGFGAIPLAWAAGRPGIAMWRGRRMPLQIGSHKTWFYPMLHPSFLLRQARFPDRPGIGSEDERAFKFDMERIFDEIKRLPKPDPHDEARARAGLKLYWGRAGDAELKAIERYLKAANKEPICGIDYETDGFRPYRTGAKILTAAVGYNETAIALALDHPQAKWTKSQRTELEAIFVEWLKTPGAIKASHNLAFEHEWSAVMFGPEVLRAAEWGCSMIQAATLDERVGGKLQGGGPLSLDFLVQQHFGFSLKALSNIDAGRLAELPVEEVLVYNAMDAKYHALLFAEQQARLKAEGLEDVYKQTVRRVPTLVRSQIKGFPVNQKVTKALAKEENAKIVSLEAKLLASEEANKFKAKMGRQINLTSNDDVLILYRDILKVKQKGDKDKYSVDKDALKIMGGAFAEDEIKLREAHKLKSTYIDPYLPGSKIIYPDGKIHPQFNSVFARSGRLSCEDPNAQNWPKRAVEGKRIRNQFAAPPDHFILAVDYGQIEARVAAMASRDEVFTKALWDRFDVHGDWARRLAEAYPKRVQQYKGDTAARVKAFRVDVKNKWTFPLIFGAHSSSLAAYLGIPEEVLVPMIREFWREFPGFAAWQKEQIRLYNERGYVETLTGRRRHAPLSANQIFNSPIQGTACELIMDAMSRLSEEEDWDTQPNLQIHDDLTFIVHKKNIDKQVEHIVSTMLDLDFDFINCPITVEVSIGKNLAAMEEVLAASSDEWKVAA